MATSVYESTVVCAPVAAVWQLVKNCDFRFLNAVESATLEHGSAWCEVGSVRCITYADKHRSRRWYCVDELSDANHQLTYSMQRAEPEVPVQAAIHTIRLRRVTKPTEATFIQFVTEFSRDVTEAVLDESRAHKAAFFAGVNRALRQDYAKDQREPEHHTPLERLLRSKEPARAAECRGPQAQFHVPTGAAPTFASSGQIAGKQEPTPSATSGWKSAPQVAALGVGRDVPIGRAEEKPRASEPGASIGRAQGQARGFQEGMKKACCGCSLPCNCACCKPKQSQGAGQLRPELRSATAAKPGMIKAAGASQFKAGSARDIPIRADEKGPGLGAALESPSQRARGVTRRRLFNPTAASGQSGPCHSPSFAKAAEVLERADFSELKAMTEKQVEDLWQSLPKEDHGALRVEDAEDFVDVLMDRMSSEENEMVHFVAKMLQEPGSPPSFAESEDFTPQLRDELKRWKRGAAKKLVGRLDKNRDKLIGKEEFCVCFNDWFKKQLYEELRASFFG